MPPLLETLMATRGDWAAQRAAILAWDYVTPADRTPDPIGDWSPTPGSWDDVVSARDLGIISPEQYAEVSTLMSR